VVASVPDIFQVEKNWKKFSPPVTGRTAHLFSMGLEYVVALAEDHLTQKENFSKCRFLTRNLTWKNGRKWSTTPPFPGKIFFTPKNRPCFPDHEYIKISRKFRRQGVGG
jgi:hypothetical protein